MDGPANLNSIARVKDFRAMIRSPEVLYDFDKGKVRLICDIVQSIKFSKLTVLKAIFAYF